MSWILHYLVLILCHVSLVSTLDCFDVYHNNNLIPVSNDLYVEYIRRTGIGVIERSNERNHFADKLTHADGFLTEIPTNVCHFGDIVSLVLDRNNIGHLGKLSCLVRLKILTLKGNVITTVRNDSFIGLNLTILDLSENNILSVFYLPICLAIICQCLMLRILSLIIRIVKLITAII